MKKILLLVFVIIILSTCRKDTHDTVFVTSIKPVSLIIKEITGNSGEIVNLIASGSSPHTYSPKPSDIELVSGAKAIFYVSESLDEWITDIPSSNKIKLFDMIDDSLKLIFNEPGELHGGGYDPHFWTDPLTVKSIVPKLTELLSRLNPESSIAYKKNADRFLKELDMLNLEIEQIFLTLNNKNVFLYHPSFLYMLRRYGMNYCGSIETFAGKEPSPKDVVEIVKSIRSFEVKVIFSEPQLPERIIKVIAESAGVSVFQLDPIGSINAISSYSDLITYNARTIQKALR